LCGLWLRRLLVLRCL
nr:immunoglobulin heavy chain junction region [Mus musculus]